MLELYQENERKNRCFVLEFRGFFRKLQTCQRNVRRRLGRRESGGEEK